MEQARFKRKTITMEVLQSQQYKKRIRRIIFYTGLFFLVTLIFLTVVFAVFFRIREIKITGVERYKKEDIMAVLPVKTEDNLYSFKTEDVETTIIKSLSYIGEVKVTRSIPSHLNIKITEAEPVMYFCNDGYYYLLSDRLRVLARTKNFGEVPGDAIKLNLSETLRCIVGEPLSFVDERSYDAVTELYLNIRENELSLSIKEIDIESRFDIYLQYEDRYSVYMGDVNNADLKIQFLKVIINKINEEDLEKTGSIDISNHREATADLE